MNFEIIKNTGVQDKNNGYELHFFCIYRETTTDVLYVARGKDSALTPMLNPETGLPLTYKIWQEKYQNK